MLAMNERFYSWLMTIPFSCSVRSTVRSKPKPTAKKCGHVPLNAFSTASMVTMRLFTESMGRCVEKVWAAYLSLNESLKNGLSNLQGCDKVVLGTRIGTINKNRKDSSRFAWNKGLFLTGLAIHLASSLQEDTKTNPKLTAAMAEHSMLHASVAISLSPWNWLKYIDIDFGIKHLARFEPFYQFILQNCYNLCPQLAKNLNLELSNKSPSVHKRNVLGFFWARKFFGRSCSRLPTVSTIIGVRFSSKSWKQFCVSSKTEHGQWRTHSSTEEKSCTTAAAAPPQHACRGQIKR